MRVARWAASSSSGYAPSSLCLLSVGQFSRDLSGKLAIAAPLRFDHRLASFRLVQQRLAMLEALGHRDQLRTWIFHTGILSGQHEPSGGRRELHGGQLQDGLSLPGRLIDDFKPTVRQEPKSF